MSGESPTKPCLATWISKYPAYCFRDDGSTRQIGGVHAIHLSEYPLQFQKNRTKGCTSRSQAWQQTLDTNLPNPKHRAGVFECRIPPPATYTTAAQQTSRAPGGDFCPLASYAHPDRVFEEVGQSSSTHLRFWGRLLPLVVGHTGLKASQNPKD